MRAPDKRQALQELRARNIPMETIIDVGVREATPDLIALFPDKKHILFEPVEEFSAKIRMNYRNIDYTLVTAPVSDNEGEVTLQVRSMLEGTAITHSTIVASQADSKDKRTMKAVTLDGYLSRNPQRSPYLLKIDVDGFEMQIMKGGLETLRNSSVVIIEAPRKQLTTRVVHLEALGFEIFDLVEPCYYDKCFWQCDAIMIKRDLQLVHFGQLTKDFSMSKYEMFKYDGK